MPRSAGNRPSLSNRSVVTPTQNLIPWSENLTQWTPNNMTATLAGDSGPGGSVVSRMYETIASSFHYMKITGDSTGIALGELVTATICVKLGVGTASVAINAGNGSNYITINLTTGLIVGVSTTYPQYTVNPLQDGWWQVSITVPRTANFGMEIYGATSTGGLVYTGSTSNYLLLTRMQVSKGNGIAPYIKTVNLAINNGTPRVQTRVQTSRQNDGDGIFYVADFTNPDIIPISTSSNASQIISAFQKLGIRNVRNSSNSTVQTGVNSLISGIGSNTPRIGNFGTIGGQGYLSEFGTRNYVWNNDLGTNWTDNSGGSPDPGAPTSSASGLAPDGVTTSRLITFPAVSAISTYSRRSAGTFNGTATKWTVSMWVKGAVGGEQTYISATPDGTTYAETSTGTLNTTWVRKFATSTFTSAAWTMAIGTDRRSAGQAATSAGSVYAAFAQAESYGFPSSPIITSGTFADRAVDVTYFNSASLVRGGVLNVEFRFTPLANIGDFGGAITVYYESTNNYIAINMTNGSVQAIVGGVLVYGSSTLVSWVRQSDVVDLWIRVGGNQPTLCSYRKNDGAEVKLSSTSGPAPFWPTGQTPEIIGGNGAGFPALFHKVIGRFDTKPNWVA